MNPAAPLPRPTLHARLLAEQALSRAAGAPLVAGNTVELLIDGAAHFAAWQAAIESARSHVFIENYIIADDPVGRGLRDALIAAAQRGARVCVIHDWLGNLGNARAAFWLPLRAAGVEVRVYNRLRADSPFGWISRDHRKLVLVDGVWGSLSGVCAAAKWLGDPARGVPPWRDTGLVIRGPALGDLELAFRDSWAGLGTPLDLSAAPVPEPVGTVALRVIATHPQTAGLYRLDQLVAAMAQRTLWLTDAYFVGIPTYVQGLVSAARDGVDVRLLVPGSSNLHAVAALSRAGYRPLLEAGIRVFEWNGSMLHAKTAVADGRWARVGSSNLNLSSWLANLELDAAIDDEDFAGLMTEQYERDLANATEIVLADGRRPRPSGAAPPRPRRAGGSSSRAAAGALRLANTVGAALSNRRVLGPAEGGTLLAGGLFLLALAILAALLPQLLAWPLALLCGWIGASLLRKRLRLQRRRTPR